MAIPPLSFFLAIKYMFLQLMIYGRNRPVLSLKTTVMLFNRENEETFY